MTDMISMQRAAYTGRPVGDVTRMASAGAAGRSLILANCVAVLVYVVGHYLPFVQAAERWLYDVRVALLTPTMPTASGIAVVAITEESIRKLPYRSPLDRRFLSELLAAIAQKNPRAVAIDILFDQPTEASKDEELRRTIASLGVPVVVASATENDGLTSQQAHWRSGFLNGVRQGNVSLIADRIDHSVRRLYLGRYENGRWMPGFAAEVAAAVGLHVEQGPPPALAYRGSVGTGAAPFPVFQAHMVPSLPREWFEGRIVLIGSDLALVDRHRTPLSVLRDGSDGLMPGVKIHAHAVAQLLEGRKLRVAGPGIELTTVLTFTLAGWALALWRGKVWIALIGATSGFAVLWMLAVAGFAWQAYMIPLALPSLAYSAAFAATLVLLRRGDWEQKRLLREAFTRYVPPQYVHRLLLDPSLLRLGGHKKQITCITTDIIGFTAIIERMEPTAMVQLVNRYMDQACRVIFEHRGTLDKMVGDALHVFFNAPIDQPGHEERAVRCALALDAVSEAFAAEQRAAGIDFKGTRIGVSTGEAVIGNFGGRSRFDYTAYGDVINTAARIESANRQLGTRVCVAGSTRRACSGIAFRPVGSVLLRGKSTPIELFEPLTDTEAKQDRIRAYLDAFALLSSADSRTAARQAFEALARQYPQDALIAFHARRTARGEHGTIIRWDDK